MLERALSIRVFEPAYELSREPQAAFFLVLIRRDAEPLSAMTTLIRRSPDLRVSTCARVCGTAFSLEIRRQSASVDASSAHVARRTRHHLGCNHRLSLTPTKMHVARQVMELGSQMLAARRSSLMRTSPEYSNWYVFLNRSCMHPLPTLSYWQRLAAQPLKTAGGPFLSFVEDTFSSLRNQRD